MMRAITAPFRFVGRMFLRVGQLLTGRSTGESRR
jgi:hypothetical protein